MENIILILSTHFLWSCSLSSVTFHRWCCLHPSAGYCASSILVFNIVLGRLQLFTQENMETMMKEAREDSTQQVLILMAMEEITKRRPEKLTPFIEQLTTPDLWNSNCAYTISSMLQHYAVKHEVRIVLSNVVSEREFTHLISLIMWSCL